MVVPAVQPQHEGYHAHGHEDEVTHWLYTGDAVLGASILYLGTSIRYTIASNLGTDVAFVDPGA